MFPNINNSFNGNLNNFSNGNGMNNPITFMQKFNKFRKNFQGDPQQAVLNLLNNGQMSQQQFNQLQAVANQIMNSMK